jgi:uncharacterized RDD family membrane protein YckC
MQPASFTQRAIGRAIDMFVVFTLSLLALRPFYEEGNDGDAENTAPVLFVIAVLLAVVAYEVVPVCLRGQTLGKIAMRTRVVDATDDRPPGWRASLLRWVPVVVVLAVGAAISTPLTLVAIAALYLSALADPGGRTLLDKLARTRVVRAERASVPLHRTGE